MSSMASSSSASSAGTPVDNLVFAFSIFRHGDRGPLAFIPEDDTRGHWGNRTAELTKLGKQQALSLGQWYRETYGNLLPREYKREDVYVYSTDTDRTLMSAQCVLAGLYPPDPEDSWSDNFKNWQPIPVHSNSSENDELYPHVSCLNIETFPTDCCFPGYIPHQLKYEAFLEKQNLWEKWHKFYYPDLVDDKGQPVNLNLLNVMLSGDNRKIALQKHLQPCRMPQRFDFPAFALHVYHTFLLAFDMLPGFQKMGYELLKIVEKAMDDFVQKSRPTKMYLYSLHDLNIITLMGQLKLETETRIENCACLTFELHETAPDQHVVQLKLKPSLEAPETIVRLENKYHPEVEPVGNYIPFMDFKSKVVAAQTMQHHEKSDEI